MEAKRIRFIIVQNGGLSCFCSVTSATVRSKHCNKTVFISDNASAGCNGLSLAEEARVRYQANPCGICDEKDATECFLSDYFGVTLSVIFQN